MHNTGKTFVIGDIHGCHAALVTLLSRLTPDAKKDTMIFLGDYIDRGPDSRGVITKILELRQRFKRVITLKGNHEDALLSYLAGHNQEFYLDIGGSQTLASYGISGSEQKSGTSWLPPTHLSFLENLLLYWEDSEYIYVHAAMQPGLHISQQSSKWLLWGGNGQFMRQDYNFGKQVVFGHTVVIDPIITQYHIAIDCGAVYGGYLSCLVLPDMTFVKVKSEKEWPI